MTHASVFQIINVGPETVPGTPVAADTRLSSLMIRPQVRTTINKFRGMGYKFPAVATLDREWVEASLEGPITYTEIVYLLSSVMDTATPTGTPPDNTWVFTVDSDAADDPQTYTVEWGDGTRALEFAHAMVNSLTLTFSREGCELSGSMWGQAVEDAITLTPAPTEVGLIPVFATHVGVKTASTAAGLGAASELDRVVSVEWALTDRFSLAYFLDGATSFSDFTEVEPSLTCKLKMEKDAAGMAYLANMRAGSTFFLRVEAVGGAIPTGSDDFTLMIDTACKVTSDPEFSEEEGIECIEWNLEGFHDATAGWATQATVITNISAL